MNLEQPLSETKPSTNKKWIFIGLGGLAFVCICLIIVGVFAVPAIMQFVSNGGETYSGIADEKLQSDTLNLIMQYEQAQNGCNDVTLFLGNMMLRPEQTSDGSWSEIWQVNACSASHMYNITFTPDEVGGTYISVSPIDQ